MANIFLGMIIYFFINRMADVVIKKAGRACDYDCETCTAHCNGYVCWKKRKELELEREYGELSGYDGS